MINQLKSEVKKFRSELEKLEGEISDLSCELAEEKKIKKLARMIYAEEINFDDFFQGLKIIYHGSEIEIKYNLNLEYNHFNRCFCLRIFKLLEKAGRKI